MLQEMKNKIQSPIHLFWSVSCNYSRQSGYRSSWPHYWNEEKWNKCARYCTSYSV